jgi:DNA processing protein
MGDARYYIGFSHVGGIGGARIRMLLAAFGELGAAWNASENELRAAGLGPTLARNVVARRGELDLDSELGRVEASGYGIISWDDDSYPRRLREIDAPPPLLYCWGRLEDRDQAAFAVVGTRKPSAYGQQVGRELATLLASGGVTVVSGMARGVDGLAHQAALDAGGRTIAVLGSGLDRVYPPEHRKLAARIASQGAVLSEFPLGRAPEPSNFPARNRVISGMCAGVVVIEAGESSGALITAGFAAEQGREVFAVPGSIYNRHSAGTNRLIADGARPLLNPSEVLEFMNLDGASFEPSGATRLSASSDEMRILQELGSEPLHVDELSQRSQLSPAAVASCLTLLELKGAARAVGGMHYVRAGEPKPDYRVE